jgi:hypothetical protein
VANSPESSLEVLKKIERQTCEGRLWSQGRSSESLEWQYYAYTIISLAYILL